MVTNNNTSKRKYKIVGFENGNHFSINATIGQLLSNSSNDTELLYTIQELYIDDILDLKVNETICIKSSDSLFGSDAVVCRVS
jgi:hypothetical protein